MATNTMRSHFDQLFTTPEQGQEDVFGATPPATPAASATPAAAPAPAMAPLQMLLNQLTSGHNVLTPEMYSYFGGDDIMKQLQAYDPNAHWESAELSGGEGGSSGTGMRLVFDNTKLPPVSAPGGEGVTWVPANRELHNSALVYNDPVYGPLTIPQNIVKQKDPWWVTVAPLVVAGAATAGAAIPALAAGGVAGGTAAVTGGAAGLAAENIAMGAAGSPWWTEILKRAPQLARPFIPPTASTPTPPTPPSAPAVPDQFNAAAFNQSGSAAKPNSNESSLVATQFADDPYRFSNG